MAEVSLIINPKTIHAELEKMKPEMERALPQHVKAERLRPAFQGVKHDALADALHQTRHLQAIFKMMVCPALDI